MNIDTGSNVPIYLQIVREIQSAVVAGVYREGERIPSAKDMAKRLRVNPNTVQKAYTELAELGVLESRRGLGKFVRKQAQDSAAQQAESAVEELLSRAVLLGRSAKFTNRHMKQLFQAALSKPIRKGNAG